ncbi:anthrone oxygenase family protein [Streptomyces sp. 796.1]|uniref:anthrone oxygenase family protein n=1 Tax=Streptomyces sp. 796.1 TaxID=3163029 RepID=UPI0039C91DF5
MSLKTLHTAALLAATLTTGLMAGLFAAFSYAVMPGLGKAGDRTFVEGMQRINTAILNGWFMSCFLGGLAFTALALFLNLRSGADRSALPWIIAGLALYLAMFVVTSAINVPLNDALAKAATSGNPSELAAARQDFESKWVTWNTVRAIANVAAFAALIWALVLHGRATPTDSEAPGASGTHRGSTPMSAAGAPSHPGPASPTARPAGAGPQGMGPYGTDSHASNSYASNSYGSGSYGQTPGSASASAPNPAASSAR